MLQRTTTRGCLAKFRHVLLVSLRRTALFGASLQEQFVRKNHGTARIALYEQPGFYGGKVVKWLLVSFRVVKLNFSLSLGCDRRLCLAAALFSEMNVGRRSSEDAFRVVT